MSRKNQPEPGAFDALSHPLRQALYILVRQRPATAKELQRAVRRPLRCTAYHLKVLVNDKYLEADTSHPEEPLYRLHPTSTSRLPPGVAGLGRVLLFSFLEAAWGALGEVADTVVEPVSAAVAVDALGLLEASDVVEAALADLGRIAAESRQREEDGPLPHVIVTIASLARDPKGG
jgi:hypothetical protein